VEVGVCIKIESCSRASVSGCRGYGKRTEMVFGAQFSFIKPGAVKSPAALLEVAE